LLFPNDLFPFTYGDSTDPFSGRTDSILQKARDTGTAPRIMHIQTSNEYWLRGGSLPHTDPLGTEDAQIPDEVRFYALGGSQHGSGNGRPRPPTSGQLAGNPNMWAPFEDTLLVAMHRWLADDIEPPASRYPRIADGSLVASHLANGRINPDAWHPVPGINHPKAMYQVGYADYGPRWMDQRIIDMHPANTDKWYVALVPAINADNNDSATSTVLSPLTQVPLASFVPWNLRAPATGAETELARLAGGYLPFPANTAQAVQSRDSRNSIAGLYPTFADYLAKYEAATDKLIAEGYLLPEYKANYMAIAEANQEFFP
ncbi:MAG: alpha/beta hydrolase domain-containing protein, partial [Pseudohongiellaceae bacterium]